MAETKIRREDHITYVNVSTICFKEMKEEFRKQGFEFERFTKYELPEGQPDYVRIQGRNVRVPNYVCVKSYMNPDDVILLMHEIEYPYYYARIRAGKATL